MLIDLHPIQWYLAMARTSVIREAIRSGRHPIHNYKVNNAESSKYELLFRFAIPHLNQLFDRLGRLSCFKSQ